MWCSLETVTEGIDGYMSTEAIWRTMPDVRERLSTSCMKIYSREKVWVIYYWVTGSKEARGKGCGSARYSWLCYERQLYLSIFIGHITNVLKEGVPRPRTQLS